MPTLRTITLNTGFDDYYTIDEPRWGGVQTMHAYRSVCSGKGISCARSARALGLEAVAYALVGDEDQVQYSRMLQAESMPHRLQPVPGRTRHNLTLLDAEGKRVAAHFVAQGFTLENPEPVTQLAARLAAELQPGDVVSCNGSLPAGLPGTAWQSFIQIAQQAGATVVVDAQRDALRWACQQPGIYALCPNDDEVRQVAPAARTPRELIEVVAQAELPIVTLGANGVVFASGHDVWHGRLPVPRPVQSVMAGDAFLAGLVWGHFRGVTGRDVVRYGLASAAAHVAGAQGSELRDLAERNLSRAEFSKLADPDTLP